MKISIGTILLISKNDLNRKEVPQGLSLNLDLIFFDSIDLEFKPKNINRFGSKSTQPKLRPNPLSFLIIIYSYMTLDQINASPIKL